MDDMGEVSVTRMEFLPWEYRAAATEDDRRRQAWRHREVAQHGPAEIAADAYLAHSAAIFCDRLRVGARSYIGAQAYVTGEVEIGADSTINPFAVVRGRVAIGDGVRIAAHASLLGFNHSMAPEQPIFHQPLTSLGITIGDDVWIGSNAVVLDGVRVGSHAVIGAGAVVTRDVEEWAVVVGNPARKVRDRRTPKVSAATELADRLAAFADRAREQAHDLLARCHDGERFVDDPGSAPAIRPWCDAIEIADLLTCAAPLELDRDDLARRLQARQDPVSGLVAPGDLAAWPLTSGALTDGLSAFEEPASYHILCVGYALRLLGRSFAHPIRAVQDCPPAELERLLSALPWRTNAWGAGAILDGIATAIALNQVDFDLPDGPLSTVLGWLTLRADPATGMWGAGDRLQVVNGFYRLTRGSYAQFGLPLPYPEAAVRTVLAHAAQPVEFNACNILDIIHPLWLVGKQTDAHREEGRRWARSQLDQVLLHWVDGQGFAFAPEARGATPSLQGTEMWLAITWLLADYLGVADALGYRPRGVHRPEPLLAAASDSPGP